MTILRRMAAGSGIVMILSLGSATSASTGTLPEAIPLEGITSVTLTSSSFEADGESGVVSCSSQALIRKLVGVLRRGQPSKDHKCRDIGTITIHYEGDVKVLLGILPGHDEEFYQFRLRMDGTYTVYQTERTAFIDALDAGWYTPPGGVTDGQEKANRMAD